MNFRTTLGREAGARVGVEDETHGRGCEMGRPGARARSGRSLPTSQSHSGSARGTEPGSHAQVCARLASHCGPRPKRVTERLVVHRSF